MQGMNLRHGISIRVFGIGLLVLALLMTFLITGNVKASSSISSIVQTKQGAVQGTIGTNARSFLGIPYAAPPVGNLRWKAPQAHAPWTTTLQATQPGSSCPQDATPFGEASTNENCLFLNIYTPVTGSLTNLPVMFWIHGGSFIAGEGSDYDPSASLVAQGGVIVVTINYRLGDFGFLALPALSDEAADGSSGNYGLEDQQFALQWVQNNIAAFGGNAHLVTIQGESAGGFSVCANLVSPTAAGLFQQAITESGPCSFPFPTLATAETQGTTIADNLGCNQSVAAQVAACMRALSPQQLLSQEPSNFGLSSGATASSFLPFSPNIGGDVLPEALATALATGAFNHVPVLEGTNQTEGRLFVAIGFDLEGSGPLTAQAYPAAVADIVGSQDAPAVLKEYPLSNFSSPDVALSAILGDAGFSCLARATDQILSAQVPTFAYEFNDTNAPMLFLPPVSFAYGATHTDEIQYLFQVDGLASQLNTSQQALSTQMISYWTQFARTGNPNSASTANWASYNAVTDNFQSLVPPTPQLELNFSSEHNCAFWTGIAIAGILSGETI
jgi:para-nitrobenzyl esterase